MNSGAVVNENAARKSYSALPVDEQTYRLSDADLTRTYDGSVGAGTVFIQTHDCLHNARVWFGCLRVEVDHHTTLVAHCYVNHWTRLEVAKHQRAANPPILCKRFCGI